MNAEALREQSRMFQSLKPKRPFLSHEKKLYIAGEQLFRCAAPHGKDKCPCWVLNEGSFSESGFEVDHILKWSKGYRHAGQLRALCFQCHGLQSRLQRIQEADARGSDENEEEMDED